MGPNRGSGTLYNQAPTNMNNQGGPNFDKDRDRYSTGIMTAWVTAITITVGTCTIAPIGITISIVTDHPGVVRGNFFEHGRHFRFRRFFHGDWVFLTDWDSCTAWAWVNIAPGAWASANPRRSRRP